MDVSDDRRLTTVLHSLVWDVTATDEFSPFFKVGGAEDVVPDLGT